MNRLREHRSRLGWTQEQVASSVGLDQVTVSAHETGTRKLKAEHLLEYARLYQCTVDALLRPDAEAELKQPETGDAA